MEDDTDDNFCEREYQSILAEQCWDSNKILFLPTGSGKTFISIMVIKRKLFNLSEEPHFFEGGKKAFFLVNTVVLVEQQAAVLERWLLEEVGQYSGAMNVDMWNLEKWMEELATYKVFVMTSQILYDLLIKQYIKLSDIAIIVFDECHHAVEDHPMRQITRLFSDHDKDNLPRVIGLTATLLNAKPKNLDCIPSLIRELEVTLHSTIATVNSWELVKQFSTNPQEKIVAFEPVIETDVMSIICEKIDSATAICKNFKFSTEESSPSHVPGFLRFQSSKKNNEVSNLLSNISKQYKGMGIFGSYKTLEAVFVSLKVIQQKSKEKEMQLILQSMLCLLMSLSCYVESYMRHHLESSRPYAFSSPKVKCLLRALKDFNQKCEEEGKLLRAIIFVEERMTAKVLCSVLNDVAKNTEDYNFIRAAFIIGGAANPFAENDLGLLRKRTNEKIMAKFVNHEVNILIATTVLEEGVDIPSCNLVIMFDQVKHYRSYVQSKGRARHSSSLFCMLVPSNDILKTKQNIYYYREVQHFLEKQLVGNTDDRLSPTMMEYENFYANDIEPYVTSLKAQVTMTSSISLVNHYCLSMAHDRFSTVHPTWLKNKSPDGVIVAIQLTPLSPLKDFIKGPPMLNLKLAKRAAALEVCRRLHQMGELDDNLIPNQKTLKETDMEELLPLWERERDADRTLPKTGTNQMTRPYTPVTPLCFRDCAPKAMQSVYLHLIQISPAYQLPSEGGDPRKNVIWEVLKEKKDYCIVSCKKLDEICQFPIFCKFGTLNVEVSCNVKITKLSVEQLNVITEFHWNLFTSIVPITKKILGFSKDSYLVAPAITDGIEVQLDWTAIKNYSDQIENKSLLKCVVKPVHRKATVIHETYFATRICENLSGESAFPDSQFSSYKEYYLKKHNYKLMHPKWPLVEVQPIQIISNDLIPRQKGTHDNQTIHFPLETLKVVWSEGCLFLKATALPSVLHRVERMLTCKDLLVKITFEMAMESSRSRQVLPRCSLWKERNFEVNQTKKTEVFHVSFISETSTNRKRKMESKQPDAMQVVDVENDFEKVSDADIKSYVEFTKVKAKVKRSGQQNASTENTTRPLFDTPVLNKENAIKLLSDDGIMPHACHIYEALTAISSNDYVNLERLETLGDAFLKFAVTIMLFMRFPSYTEGLLTRMKGQILGNRNLFFCAQDKELGKFMKVKRFVPSEGWIPPSFSVPEELKRVPLGKLLRHLTLSKEEQFNNFVKQSSEINDVHEDSSDCIGVQEISDKSVADCVEALIGTFLKCSGPKRAFQFMEYMRVLPYGTLSQMHEFLCKTSKNTPHGVNNVSRKLCLCLGYTFKNMDLLSEAITHSSAPVQSATYERLEFIGDAILDFLITAFIFERCGELTPGDLTDLRSALVNNITFACLTVRYGFHKFLQSGSVALVNAIDGFVRYQESRKHVIDEEVLILLEERECSIAETVEVPKALGDIFEALIGAIFLDSNGDLSLVWSIIYRLMSTEINNFSKKVPKQVVRRLYETVQDLEFRVSEAPERANLQLVQVVLTINIEGEKRSFNGFGPNKQSAKKSAAKLALRQLQVY